MFQELDHLAPMGGQLLACRKELEICQAALLIISLLNSTENEQTRWRVLTKRFPPLVATVRHLGFLRKRHAPFEPTLSPSWEDWIMTESAARMAAWIFLGDALLTLYFSQPPSLVLSEMQGSLPGTGYLWLADSATDFEVKYASVCRRLNKPESCFPNLVCRFLDDEYDNDGDKDGHRDGDGDGRGGQQDELVVTHDRNLHALHLYLVL